MKTTLCTNDSLLTHNCMRIYCYGYMYTLSNKKKGFRLRRNLKSYFALKFNNQLKISAQ